MMPLDNPTDANDTATRIDILLADMTLEEKASLTVGRDVWTTQPIDRLGIPAVWFADGPTGVRKAPTSDEVGLGTSPPATCFPSASALAASWDVDLVADAARAIGAEAQAHGVQVILGPAVHLKRSPLAGRTFDSFSEDPVLSGRLAAAVIRGLQSQGVGAFLKHLAANENETGRMYSNAVVDERTLRELSLRPFEIAIAEADPWTVMASHHRLARRAAAERIVLLKNDGDLLPLDAARTTEIAVLGALAEPDLAPLIDAANRAATQPPATDHPAPAPIRHRQVTGG